MAYTGNLKKMKTQLGDPVQYQLALGEELISMNEWIGKPFRMQFTGEINCKICGRKTKKAYGQGFCYVHFMKSPENSPCILKPELCEGHLGKGRDAAWEEKHHVKPHVVYLALTNGLKVGVTRQDQVPTRWIDQGAWKAIKLAETPYRQLAGQIEVAMKAYLSDKTNWQRMLKNQMKEGLDMVAEKKRIAALLPAEFAEYASDDDEVTEIHYPVLQYPEKVKSLKLDKEPLIEGTLQGIRGQYLMLDGGRVFNVRAHTGYKVEVGAS
jgi:hypothetical protein